MDNIGIEVKDINILYTKIGKLKLKLTLHQKQSIYRKE
jgi:hypothetical protein